MRLIFSVKDLKDAIFRLNTFLDLKTSSTGTLLSINVLDIFSLLQGTLVGAQSLLGKFVNALVGSGSTGFDHIQNSAFIGTQSSNLTGNFAANQSSLGGGLTKAATTRMQCERRRSRYDDFVTCVQNQVLTPFVLEGLGFSSLSVVALPLFFPFAYPDRAMVNDMLTVNRRQWKRGFVLVKIPCGCWFSNRR